MSRMEKTQMAFGNSKLIGRTPIMRIERTHGASSVGRGGFSSIYNKSDRNNKVRIDSFTDIVPLSDI